MVFHVPSGKMAFIFLENMIFFSFFLAEDDLSQKIHGNMTTISGITKKDDAHPRKDDFAIQD